tara:strand:- start:823 stop:1287 length:465 start_codon:yes stop_codon:yes gene_type:complete
MNYNYYNISGNTAQIIYESGVKLNMGNARSLSLESEDNYGDISSSRSYQPRRLKSMSICNIHATDVASVNLYASNTIYNQSNDPSIGQRDENNTLDVIEDTTTLYYLLKGVKIPANVTMVIDLENELCFSTHLSDLYIQLGASDSAVDVIIKQY